MGERSTTRSDRCEHRSLATVDPTTGGYRLRCAVCGKVGPVRKTAEAARKALLALGARDGATQAGTGPNSRLTNAPPRGSVAEFLPGLLGPLTDLIGGALELFHSAGAPWWLSIVLLTDSVRAALFPPTIRQARSIRAMQELKPEMDQIRSEYEDDRQKQQEAMIELHRKRRINPLVGLLPLLVQLPVFITMCQVVRSHEEGFFSFANGGLLWFPDLARPDPYLVLPVLSASLLIAAGEVSPEGDPQPRWQFYAINSQKPRRLGVQPLRRLRKLEHGQRHSLSKLNVVKQMWSDYVLKGARGPLPG